MEPQGLTKSACSEIHIYLTHIPKHVCTLPQTAVNYPLRNDPKLKYKLRRCAAVMVFCSEEEHWKLHIFESSF